MQNWSKAVELELHGVGGYRTVNSTEDAARCPPTNWPRGKRNAYMAAQQACLNALEGATTPELARDFIGVALAARVHIRSTDDPRETAMRGGAAKNKLTGTDSPAFRKANHDALEAIKKTVARIKAERERSSRKVDKDNQ